MRTFTADELKVVLEKHFLWLRGEPGGERANLRDSDLRGLDLRGSDLSDSDLRDSDLRGSNLRGSNLRDSNLRDSDLRDSDLRDSDLRGSNLRGSNLSGSNLREPTPEEYAVRAARYRERHPQVPVVPALDQRICEIIDSGRGKLKMSNWHACGMTHCRGGWAIHEAGEAGYKLEAKYGPENAASMIYRASTGRWPDFFASDEDALADIEKWGASPEVATVETRQ